MHDRDEYYFLYFMLLAFAFKVVCVIFDLIFEITAAVAQWVRAES